MGFRLRLISHIWYLFWAKSVFSKQNLQLQNNVLCLSRHKTSEELQKVGHWVTRLNPPKCLVHRLFLSLLLGHYEWAFPHTPAAIMCLLTSASGPRLHPSEVHGQGA